MAAGSGSSTTPLPQHILICRNKHYPYIASYHGPWLSLPVELFQSLIDINDATKPNPVDPVIFKNLLIVRKLVDEASELVIKSMSTSGNSNSQGMFGGSNGRESNGGRVSAVRQHRFREMAVARLAKAYRIDEVATSVLTMQSASALDDVAARVLKRNPKNIDAQYVHFFHEKIQSRTLAQSTTTDILDSIIENSPSVPEYYRTRAMIYGFREEFPRALKDFKTAIGLAARRKQQHKTYSEEGHGCENQLLFLRAACYHQFAISLMDKAIQCVNKKYNRADGSLDSCNGIKRIDAGSVTLTPSTSFSMSEVLLGPMEEYTPAFKECVDQVHQLCRKSIKDYCQFLANYSISLPPFHHPQMQEAVSSPTDSALIAQNNKFHDIKSLGEFVARLPSRPPSSNGAIMPSTQKTDEKRAEDRPSCSSGCLHCSGLIGTYHPLLVEAWYIIGMNYLILGDWQTAHLWYERVQTMQSLTEGYPCFLPARSMGQADFMEIIRNLRRAFPSRHKEPSSINGADRFLAIESPPPAVDIRAQDIQMKLSLAKAVKRSTSAASLKKKPPSVPVDGIPGKHYPLNTRRAPTVLAWLNIKPKD